MFNSDPGRYGEPFIDIWNCRASIARDIPVGPHSTTVQHCLNSEDLEEAILKSIDDQGGAINQSGRLYCPPELAQRAIWESTGEV
jgi:hypothetical protein